MLCPRPRNTWREYSDDTHGYATANLSDGRQVRIMRASHKACVEMSLTEAYWEVVVSVKGGDYWVPELMMLEDLRDEPDVIRVNKERSRRESAEARKRGRN